MKKVLLITLVLVFALSILAGCTAPAAAPVPAAEPTPAAADGNIVKVGLGHVTSIEKSADLGKDKDGKVVGTIIDNAQTKVELKEAYGMIKGSTIGKEWYQQADAFV